MTHRPHAALAPIVVFGALVSSTLGASVGKTLFPSIGAEGVIALRLGFSAVILAWAAKPWRVEIDAKVRAGVLAYGIALGLMNILIYQAFARLPIGIATAIEVTGPLAVALIYSRSLANVIWCAVAAAGLALLIPTGTTQSLDPVGLLFAAGAAACWALYILFGKTVTSLRPLDAVSLGMIIAATFAVPFGIHGSTGSLVTLSVLCIGLLVALLSSILPYLLEMFAFHLATPRVVGMLLSAAPAVAAFMGATVLGEDLSVQQWVAIALVMSGCAGCALKSPS